MSPGFQAGSDRQNASGSVTFGALAVVSDLLLSGFSPRAFHVGLFTYIVSMYFIKDFIECISRVGPTGD